MNYTFKKKGFKKSNTLREKPSSHPTPRAIQLTKIRPYIFDEYFKAKRIKTLAPRPIPNPIADLILNIFN
jgi:hypothetical protein